jgi:hypothetical protein
LLDKHAQGNYEPKAVLVELGVWPERARRKGATATGELWARPTLYTRVSNNQNGREREWHNERRGASALHLDLVEQFLIFPVYL